MSSEEREGLFDALLREIAEHDGELALDDMARVALAAPSQPPPAALADRIRTSSESEHRWPDLIATVRELGDLGEDVAADLLRAIDGGERWSLGPNDDVQLLHFDGGPRVANSVTGFVRIAPGGEFPDHEHVGDEVVLVMQGAFRDELDGRTHGRGAVVRMGAGSAHRLRAVGPLPLVYMAVIEGGVRIGGELIAPGDPRG